MIRAVLDTNVFISALLFSGPTAALVPAWQSKFFHILLSRSNFDELLRALSYPKFQLTQGEIRALLENQILPYAEVVKRLRPLKVKLRDPDDLPVLACAASGKADYLVTEDKDLLSLDRFRRVEIITPGAFLRRLEGSSMSLE